MSKRVSLATVRGHPDQPRHDLGLNPAFVRSIEQHGIVVPVILHPNGDDGYTIGDGHRRVAGLRQTERDYLAPHEYVVRKHNGDATLVVRIANAHRRDLNPLEWAAIFAADAASGSSHDEIAETYGVSRGKVGQYLKLQWALEQPTREAVLEGHLSFAHARQLSRLSDPDDAERDAQLRTQQRDLVRQCAEETWRVTTRRLEAWVTAVLFPQEKPPASPAKSASNLPLPSMPDGNGPPPIVPAVVQAILDEGDDPLVLHDAHNALAHVQEAGRLLRAVLNNNGFNNTLSRQVTACIEQVEAGARDILEVLR